MIQDVSKVQAIPVQPGVPAISETRPIPHSLPNDVVSLTTRPIAVVDEPVAESAGSDWLPIVPGVAPETLRRMTVYIQHQWQNLRRNAISSEALEDSKSAHKSRLFAPEVIRKTLPAHVAAQPLVVSEALIRAPGLLYLPRDFVVPGGRFNEQYGWDSYFTVRGLLEDGEVNLARSMVDNLLFEVDHYGRVLNANRTYYLGRSSPPFLARTVLDVYRRTGDKGWLEQALPTVVNEYETWHDGGEAGHRTSNGLSRYASEIGHACPEVEEGYYDSLPTDREFYRNDRAERESGWDMTDRFDYRCMDFNPVDLNGLLHQTEKAVAQMHRELGGEDSPESRGTSWRSTMWSALRAMPAWATATRLGSRGPTPSCAPSRRTCASVCRPRQEKAHV